MPPVGQTRRSARYAQNGTSTLDLADLAEGEALGLVGGVLASLPVGSAPVGGTSYLLTDPDLTLGSVWTRSEGLLCLLADKTWGANIANALTSPPDGWTWTNTTYVTSAAVTGGEMVIVFSTAATQDWLSPTFTASRLRKSAVYAPPESGVIYFRLKAPALNATTRFFLFQLLDSSTDNAYFHVGLRGSAGAGNLYYKFGPSVGVNSTAVTTANMAAGIWFRVVIRGRQVGCGYSLAVQSTPPSTWTNLATTDAYWTGFSTTFYASFLGLLTATGGTHEGTVSYYDDSLMEAIPGLNINSSSCARGFDATSPVLKIVDADLGTASAVVADADVQATLSQVVNTRARDAATWTFSVVRGSSASPAAGAYAAAGSVTVSGTGRYIAVYAKCLSTSGGDAGSLADTRIRIPYTV
jgi:hypothetical protein